MDVGLIDKVVFPRNKLCGGLLTLKSRQVFSDVFGTPWDEVFEHQAEGIRFFSKHRLLNSVENYSQLFFTRRLHFDHHLLQLAEAKGTTLYLGQGIASIDTVRKICHLRSGEAIGYDHLIGADGVNSLVAKTLFGAAYNKDKIALALEVEVDKAHAGRLVDRPEIYFGIVNWGYGWVFPKKDTLTVGVGGLQSRNPRMKEDFAVFLRDLFGDLPQDKIKGHHLPFGDYKKTPGQGQVLLAGDAAGLVEPITGEGIAFAMQSGHFAARAIVETINLRREGAALQAYQRRYREITRDLDRANLLRYFIFPKPSEYLLVKALPNTRDVPMRHLDLMAGTMKYEDYTRYLAGKAVKEVARRALFLK